MVWNSIPVLVMAAITGYICLYHLVKVVLQRKTLEDLYFALLCLSVVLYDLFSIGLYNSVDVSISLGWQRGQFFAIAMLATFTVFFIYRITGTRVDALFRAAAAVYSLLGLAALLPLDLVLSAKEPMIRSFSLFSRTIRYVEAVPGPLMQALFVLVGVGMVYGVKLLLGVHFAGRKERILPLLVAYALFFLTAALDMLNGLGIIRTIYLIEYSFLALVLVMEHSLLVEFVEMHAQIESLNVALEERVRNRTRRVENLLEQLSAKNAELEETNIRLQRIAERDSLTELLNHAAFHRRLGEILNESRRNHFSFALLMFDVDSFKSLNDSYGHPVGDTALRKISDVLRGQARDYDVKSRVYGAAEDLLLLRSYDVAGRYGGDEFALILPYCGEPEAEIVCRRVSASIQAIRLEEHTEVRITISLGGAVLGKDVECRDAQVLIKAADRELYRCKEGGRNQFRIAPYRG
jgi:GGDEF domain-containing protein